MKPVQLFSHWEEIRAGLLTTLAKFDPADFTFIPFTSAWSVGKIALHIADAEEGWFRYVVTRDLSEWPDQYEPENYPTFEAAKAALAQVHARTEDFLGSLAETDLAQMIETPWGAKLPLLTIIWHVIEHEIHHRGELSLILGLLGREGLEV